MKGNLGDCDCIRECVGGCVERDGGTTSVWLIRTWQILVTAAGKGLEGDGRGGSLFKTVVSGGILPKTA